MLLVDVGAAMVAAIIVLAITPGLAVAGLIAIVGSRRVGRLQARVAASAARPERAAENRPPSSAGPVTIAPGLVVTRDHMTGVLRENSACDTSAGRCRGW